MYPRPIQKLIEQFQRLPGIGPKQAAKFAFKVLRMNDKELALFSHILGTIKKETHLCAQCSLTFEDDGSSLCPICRNPERKQVVIAVVETEQDAYTIEKSQAFNGVYHILGTRISLAADSLDTPALTRLQNRLAKLEGPEVILAMNATTDGGATALFLERSLKPLGVKISRLARGFSSGTEIEYADKDTLIDAFRNRR